MKPAPPAETARARLKRLQIRSMRRGIKEMDVILEAFAAEELGAMPPEMLDRYEALLEHNDHDLYAWIAGRGEPPPALSALVTAIRAHVAARHAGPSRSPKI